MAGIPSRCTACLLWKSGPLQFTYYFLNATDLLYDLRGWLDGRLRVKFPCIITEPWSDATIWSLWMEELFSHRRRLIPCLDSNQPSLDDRPE